MRFVSFQVAPECRKNNTSNVFECLKVAVCNENLLCKMSEAVGPNLLNAQPWISPVAQEMKACICQMVYQILLLPFMHCLDCFCNFINTTAYVFLGRYKPSSPVKLFTLHRSIKKLVNLHIARLWSVIYDRRTL